jgi:hypothetical protein
VKQLDSTPRYAKITYRNADGKRATFIGMATSDGQFVRSQRREGARCDDITLHVLVAAVADVLKVQFEDRYGDWR